jgi:hypothetical protein
MEASRLVLTSMDKQGACAYKATPTESNAPSGEIFTIRISKYAIFPGIFG